MDDIIIDDNQSLISHDLIELKEKVLETAINSKAKNTRKAYTKDWELYEAWCLGKGLSSMPSFPETVAMYLVDISREFKASTIQRKLSSISQAHEMAGQENPTRTSIVRTTMQGIKRELGTAPNQKKPTMTDDIIAMLDCLPDNLIGRRDKALLLLGFAGAFRRSELIALDVEDIQFVDDGMIVSIRRSKTDQEGKGDKKGIYKGRNGLCPVQAMKEWLDTSGVTSGPIFRYVDKGSHIHDERLSDRAVAEIIKKRAKIAGLDYKEFSGHSLRAGCATVAAAAGAQDRDIMRMTGHKSVSMVQRYVRDGNIFRNNVSGMLGL